MSKNFIASRRDLLKSGGALVVSFSFFGRPGETLAQAAAAAKPVALTAVDTFLAIDATGMVTVYSGKVDLGTGVRTALAQIVADELDVPFNRVEIVQGDTALTPDQGPTFGSLSIQVGGVQIRNAAAMARSALLDLAATQLGVKPDELTVSAGTISGGGKTVSYGELDRRQGLFARGRPHQAAEDQGCERLQDRRHLGPARRHSGQGDRQIHLHARLPRARHAARPRDTAAGDRSDAAKRRRVVDQRHCRRRQARARGQLPRRRCRE